MVLIECPHCDEELEMDDDSFGIFECPLCEMEYEWGEAKEIVYIAISVAGMGKHRQVA